MDAYSKFGSNLSRFVRICHGFRSLSNSSEISDHHLNGTSIDWLFWEAFWEGWRFRPNFAMIGVWNMIFFSMIISRKIACGLHSATAYIRKNMVPILWVGLKSIVICFGYCVKTQLTDRRMDGRMKRHQPFRLTASRGNKPLKGALCRISSYTCLFAKHTGWIIVIQ